MAKYHPIVTETFQSADARVRREALQAIVDRYLRAALSAPEVPGEKSGAVERMGS